MSASSRRRAVYMRDDQWELIETLLEAALRDIGEDLRFNRPSVPGRHVLHWATGRINEVREMLGAVPP